MEPQNIDSSVLEKSKFNKSYLKYFLILLVACIVFYFVFAPLFQKKYTGLEVAVKINSFLDKSLLKNGGMIAGFGCSKVTKECSEIVPINNNQPHLGQAIYSYYLLGQVTGDASYRAKSDKAMDFVLESCKTNVEMCAWNFFPMSRYYFDTKENKYLIGMLAPSVQFLRMNSDFVIDQNVGHKLGSLYKATNDEKYKTKLLEVANGELAKWPYGPEVHSGRSIQVIWSVFLPAYEITKDKKYLVASENYFNTFDLSKNFYRFLFLDPIVKGADALITLSEISEKGAFYKEQAHSTLQLLIDTYWDSPENVKVSGDYGFIEMPERGKENVVWKKTITNGWISKSFIRLPNDKFNLPKNKK
ncbi:MAG: hypothetical protein ABL917_03160 [Parcubacteria group bacterium]